MASQIITTIEITDTHIKLLQAKGQRGLLITYGQIVKIEQPTDEHVTELLAQMVSARGFEAGEIIVIIPRRFAILKHIKLPSQSDAEIKRMVGLQIGNHVPYSREDVVFDSMVLDKDVSGYAKILLLIVHKDVVHRYLKIFDKVKMHPHRLVLSSFGIAEWFTYQMNKLKEREGITALINVDETNSEICFIHHRHLVFSRSIHYGAKDFSEEKIDGFLEQIGLTFGNYKKENMGPEITRIVVITTVKEVAFLVDKLKEYYQLPVDVRSAFDNLPCHKDFNLSSLWQQSGLSLASPVGFLLGDIKKQINFMPLNIQATKKSQRQKRAWLQMTVLVFVVAVLSTIAFNISFYHDTAYLRKVEEKIRETRSQVDNARTKMESIEFLSNKVKNPVFIADIVKELYKRCPAEMSFNALYLDSKGTLTIQGITTTGSAVNSFQTSLVNSPLFKAVNLEFATKRKRFQEEYTDFQITCKLSLPQASEI